MSRKKKKRTPQKPAVSSKEIEITDVEELEVVIPPETEDSAQSNTLLEAVDFEQEEDVLAEEMVKEAASFLYCPQCAKHLAWGPAEQVDHKCGSGKKENHFRGRAGDLKMTFAKGLNTGTVIR